MKIFKKFSQHFKIRSLQNQFDEQVAEVQRLMAEGKVKESGVALLEAEKLRKKIESLEGLVPDDELQCETATENNNE